MLKKPNPPADAAALRQRAEQRQQAQGAKAWAAHSEADTQRLVHELQVHEVELEMQNEELQKTTDEMEAAMQKYSDLYDFAPVGYVTLDREGTIREANLIAASLLGIERSRLTNRTLGRFLLAADRPAFDAFLTRVFASKARAFCEVTLLREGQSSVLVRIEAAVSESGPECRAVLTDVTERNRMEADRLILSKLESTGILAGGIAHDFNNLLTVILLNLERARRAGGPGVELEHILDEAKKAVLTAGGVAQQFITLAKGGVPVRKSRQLAKIIRESAQLALSGSRVRCDFSLADDLWPAEVDEGQIGQAIRNLLLNAREAMPEGGVVSIRAENVVMTSDGIATIPPGDYVRVRIADQGKGIAKELLPRIFDPYFSTKQRGAQKGMGLGLTICHAVVQKHGGAIAVESEMGIGTTVQIDLPAAGRQREVPPSSVPASPGRPGRILVMDDDRGLREVLKTTLQRMGHEVEAVEDGQQAIEAYSHGKNQRRPFDLLILNLTVPGGVGALEAIRELRKLDPFVKAIVMSGHAADPVMLGFERHGFKDALTKPFEQGRLQQLLARVMGGCPPGIAA